MKARYGRIEDSIRQRNLCKYTDAMKLYTDLFSAGIFEIQQTQEPEFSEMKKPMLKHQHKSC